MRGADKQGGDSRIRDTSTVANVQKTPPTLDKGPRAKWTVWPPNHPNRPDGRKGFSTPKGV